MAATDQVDKATAAAGEERLVRVEMTRSQFTLATGRPAALELPADVTDFELLNLVSAVLHTGDQLRAARKAKAPVIARASVLPKSLRRV